MSLAKRNRISKITSKNNGWEFAAKYILFLWAIAVVPVWTYAIEDNTISVNNGITTIVTDSDISNDLVVTDGHITATNGKSIRFLPGTKIKKGEHLKIDISTKAHQEIVAERLAKEKEKSMLAFVGQVRDELLGWKYNGELVHQDKLSDLPPKNSTLQQSENYYFAIVITSNYSFSAPTNALREKNYIQNIHNIRTLASLPPINSSFKWGDRAENIMVMLC